MASDSIFLSLSGAGKVRAHISSLSFGVERRKPRPDVRVGEQRLHCQLAQRTEDEEGVLDKHLLLSQGHVVVVVLALTVLARAGRLRSRRRLRLLGGLVGRPAKSQAKMTVSEARLHELNTNRK